MPRDACGASHLRTIRTALDPSAMQRHGMRGSAYAVERGKWRAAIRPPQANALPRCAALARSPVFGRIGIA